MTLQQSSTIATSVDCSRRRYIIRVAVGLCSIVFASRLCAQTGRTYVGAQTNSGGVPGIASASFGSFDAPLLGSTGNIAFQGTLQAGLGGVSEGDDTGIWGSDDSGMYQIAREGVGNVPGIVQGNYASFSNLVVRGNGVVAFRATLESGVGSVTSDDDTGIWGPASNGALSLIAREGSGAVPGVPGASFRSFSSSPALNGSGSVAFRATLRSGSGSVTNDNDGGIWGPDDATGELSLRVRKGSNSVPGVVGGDFSTFAVLNLINTGEIGFSAFLKLEGGVALENNWGLWGPDGSGSLTLVARTGAAGVPGIVGADYGGLLDMFLNSDGKAAFVGTLRVGTGDVNATNESGIFGPDKEGNLSLVARRGSGGVPGISGASFQEFLWDARLSDSGIVSFGGQLVLDGTIVTTDNDRGVWGPDPYGNLVLLARTGSGGVPNVAGANFSTFGTMMMNSPGNVAFLGSLRTGDGGVTANNDRGLWIGDGIELVEVAREGQMVAGKELAAPELMDFPGQESSGQATAINDFGQIAYRARFTDSNQGIILWTPDLHWRGTAADNLWASRTNWTLSLPPAFVHQLFIDPAADTTITGPGTDTTVKSIQIGGAAGKAKLVLQEGVALTATDGVTLAANGVLAGKGTIDGPLNVAGGVLSPGQSVGSLLLGSLSFDGGAYAVDVDLDAGESDLIQVMGSVDLSSATLLLTLLDEPMGAIAPSRTFLLIDNDGSDPIVGTFNGLDPLPTAGVLEYVIDYAFTGAAVNGVGDGNDVAITLSVVPEPAGMLLLIPMILLIRRRPRPQAGSVTH